MTISSGYPCNAAFSGVAMTQMKTQRTGAARQAPADVLWTGRSGRRYLLTPVEGTGAALVAERLYALVENNVIRWAGTAASLIEDQASRARFRLLSGNGAQMLALDAPADPLAVMTLVWDLEGSAPHRAGLSAA